MGETARILVVDDDENIRKVLTAILEDEGYTVDSVGTGRKAVARTRTTFYNIALIDIRLPDIEGIELLTKMRSTTPKMRKIVITGYPTLQNAVEAVNQGADAYIIKPFNVKRVIQTIKKQLEKQLEETIYNQERVAEFIETRVRELERTGELIQKKKS
ncbi:response regulator [Candidatus Bathyarchaeota archaeon]|nr:response regulator [Candidatus Bathyarchaeota archaeon]